ncbi:FHA domain-containing protein At4g14490-like [Nymphaea colorata]|uniref:FHA domain-containing protein n=1 Tax=Nymphaea colorata TaxID=210225 RepID=A0A5K1CNY6_9MAGN|nr:FHA domain-containing protein At4g14490-like [Nymphaea colorata]XP_031482611.1 FHA domain-containing protein At4g14490-like [Nymphaea colorata]XP_049933271.1 FHA domain-containing protein At4g14490-like [Nymphaea colorata]
MGTKRSLLKLIVEKGRRKGEIIECAQSSDIRIGRVIKGNNFTIKDPAISQQHLVVEFRDGRWVVLDLDTSNGTMLNDKLIPPQAACAVRDGDVIKVGEKSALFVRISEEEGDAGVAADPSNIVEEKPSPEVVVRRNPSRRAAAALTRSTRGLESISVDVGKRRAKVPKNKLVSATVGKKQVSIAQNVEAAEECSKEMEKNEIVNDRGMQQSRNGEKDEKELGGEQPGSSKKNMENITLGQWLDRMEVWLPKQIRDVSEDLIELMRERAKQVEEFVSHQEAGNKTAA